MNVNLEWITDFLAINVFEETIYPNFYTAKLSMTTHTDDANYQNIAFDRLKVLIHDRFDGAAFMDFGNPRLETFFNMIPEKLVVLPEECHDQVIGIALFCKANAVMEQAITVDSVKIQSSIGDDITYYFKAGDELGAFEAANIKVTKKISKKKIFTPWWNRSDLMTFDATGDIQITTWGDLGLEWDEKFNIKSIKTEPVKKSFQAEIVDGGKTPHED